MLNVAFYFPTCSISSPLSNIWKQSQLQSQSRQNQIYANDIPNQYIWLFSRLNVCKLLTSAMYTDPYQYIFAVYISIILLPRWIRFKILGIADL